MRAAARRVVVLAQEAARRLDHDHIGTEHLLLGLVREGDGTAVLALVKLGADPNRIRERVLTLLGDDRQQPSSMLDGDEAEEPLARRGRTPSAVSKGDPTVPPIVRLDRIEQLLEEIVARLSAIERRLDQ